MVLIIALLLPPECVDCGAQAMKLAERSMTQGILVTNLTGTSQEGEKAVYKRRLGSARTNCVHTSENSGFFKDVLFLLRFLVLLFTPILPHGIIHLHCITLYPLFGILIAKAF